jgi:hypothetical protein
MDLSHEHRTSRRRRADIAERPTRLRTQHRPPRRHRHAGPAGGSPCRTGAKRSHSTTRADAVRLLKRSLGEIRRGRLIGPDVVRTTFSDLAAMLVTDYRANGAGRMIGRGCRRTLARAHSSGICGRAKLPPTGSQPRLLTVRLRRPRMRPSIESWRPSSGMFRLGEVAGKVARRPIITMLHEDNVRKGFFEEPAIAARPS